MNNTIFFVRNSDFITDSRMRRAAGVALDLGLNVSVLSWNRIKGVKQSFKFPFKGGAVDLFYYNKKADFGKGLYNILNLALYNIWIAILLIRKRKCYEAIHVCDLDVAIPTLLAKLILGKRVCYDIFDFYAHTHAMPRLVSKMVAWLEFKVCDFADFVIVCNENRKMQLPAHVQKKTIVIHNTPDVMAINLNRKVEEGNPFKVCYVGTLPAHGRLLKEIIESFPEHLDVHLDVAGNGPLEDFIIESQGNIDRLKYHGHVSIESALNLQLQSDLLFATYDPSVIINKNSAPNKIYEAMALSKPIIVCKHTDADKIVLENKMGVAIGYSADEFWEAVELLMSNSEYSKRLGENAYVAYRTKYSWTSMVPILSCEYKKLID